jgi:hypothetical protein
MLPDGGGAAGRAADKERDTMESRSRSLGRRSALIAMALTGLLALAPAPAQAVDGKEAGLGAACALGNLIYGPAKLIYAMFGGLTAGFGYVVTAGDVDVMRTILDTSVNGDYVLEPAHLTGQKTLQFVGGTSTTVPQDDWSTAENSGF